LREEHTGMGSKRKLATYLDRSLLQEDK
jgi:hypothetical protein